MKLPWVLFFRNLCLAFDISPADAKRLTLYQAKMLVCDESDITGLRRLHHMSYPDIAGKIQAAIHAELDLTVSVGLSLLIIQLTAYAILTFNPPDFWLFIDSRNGFRGVPPN
jgi:hypothetical protein